MNWVGISVALHIDGSMDSTVETKRTGVAIPTFSDASLRTTIRALRQAGLHVYLTLAIEDHEAKVSPAPVQRWQLGDPYQHLEDSRIRPDLWPWRPDHPDHERFVAEFWGTYNTAALHVAAIAQSEGVEMYSRHRDGPVISDDRRRSVA